MLDTAYNQSRGGYDYALNPSNSGWGGQANTGWGSPRSGNTTNNIGPSTAVDRGGMGSNYGGGYGGGMLGQDLADARSTSPALRDVSANLFLQGANRAATNAPFGQMAGGRGYVMPQGFQDVKDVVWNPLKGMAVGGYSHSFDQPHLNKWREWEDTGGYSPQSVGQIRSQMTATVPAHFEQMRNDMERRRTLQGPSYSSGYDDQMQEMSREAGREGHMANIQAEGNLQQMIHQGKQFGQQGLSDFYKNMADRDLDARKFGNQAMMGLGQSELDANKWMADISNNKDNAIFEGARGLAGLYGSNPGGLNSAYGNFFSGLQGRDQASLGYLGDRYRANPQTDWWGRITNLAGGIGGLATGFGGMGGGGQQQAPGQYYSPQYLNQYNPYEGR